MKWYGTGFTLIQFLVDFHECLSFHRYHYHRELYFLFAWCFGFFYTSALPSLVKRPYFHV